MTDSSPTVNLENNMLVGGMPTRSLGMVEIPCLNPLSAGVGMPPSYS